jgi:hypothetical protein
MPTGYTAVIEERDDVTFEEFTMRCARAFGACISMKEDSLNAEIPKELVPSDYHIKEVERIESERQKMFTTEEAEAHAQADYEKQKEFADSYLKKEKWNAAKYKKLLAKVRAWEPPTPDHVGLKEFMIDQIRISMPKEPYGEYLTKPTKLTGVQWLENRNIQLRKGLEYHKKKYAEECERTAGRNLWLKQLRKSLGVD